MDPIQELLFIGKADYWDLTTFISPEIHYNSVILFTKRLFPSLQVDMLFQSLIFLAKMLLARNSQMGCKGERTYAVLSPYVTSAFILV